MQIQAYDEWSIKFDAKPRVETPGVANSPPDTFKGDLSMIFFWI